MVIDDLGIGAVFLLMHGRQIALRRITADQLCGRFLPCIPVGMALAVCCRQIFFGVCPFSLNRKCNLPKQRIILIQLHLDRLRP